MVTVAVSCSAAGLWPRVALVDIVNEVVSRGRRDFNVNY